MSRPSPLPDPLRAAAFGPAAAQAAGLDANRLRRKDLHRPFHGVRVATPPVTVVDRCRAYLPRLKPGQFLSHSTAALLHGHSLPEVLAASIEVHVAALLPADAPHARNVRGHRLLDALPPVDVAGVPVAHQLDAFCQLAQLLDLEDLVVVADELLAAAGVEEEVARRLLLDRISAVRRVGAAKLVRAARSARAGARSAAETRVRLVLLAGGIEEPELDAPIQERGTGRYLGAPDLVWRDRRVLLEYEGDGHRVDQWQFRHDILRYDDLAADG